MNDKVYILLGSNLEDRANNLETALSKLATIDEIEILNKSGVYNSPAMEMNEPAPDFLNQVIEIGTELSPIELLHELKQIEIDMGRMDKGKYRSRNIDLDILMYGEKVIETDELTIPQARMLKRTFALVPLSEIAPELIHPVTKEKIRNYVSESDYNIVVKIEEHAAASS